MPSVSSPQLVAELEATPLEGSFCQLCCLKKAWAGSLGSVPLAPSPSRAAPLWRCQWPSIRPASVVPLGPSAQLGCPLLQGSPFIGKGLMAMSSSRDLGQTAPLQGAQGPRSARGAIRSSLSPSQVPEETWNHKVHAPVKQVEKSRPCYSSLGPCRSVGTRSEECRPIRTPVSRVAMEGAG